MTNISQIRPAEGAIKRILAACKVFLNYSFYLVDLFYLSHDEERINRYRIDVKGRENFTTLIEKNKGCIFLTLHMGNWEIGGAVFSSTGKEPYIVYSPDTEGTIETNRKDLRTLFNIREFPLNEGAFSSIKLLNILRDGGVVAFQGDRLRGDSGIGVNFFGKKAFFPKGPFVLSMVSDVPILPAFSIMKGYNRYEVHIEKPYNVNIYPSRDETLKKSLEDIVIIFEKYISEYAEQWYSFMPFWVDMKRDMR